MVITLLEFDHQIPGNGLDFQVADHIPARRPVCYQHTLRQMLIWYEDVTKSSAPDYRSSSFHYTGLEHGTTVHGFRGRGEWYKWTRFDRDSYVINDSSSLCVYCSILMTVAGNPTCKQSRYSFIN